MTSNERHGDGVARIAASAAFVASALGANGVSAHDFVMRYDLPIPFDLYLYASAAALVLTFVVFGALMRTPVAAGAPFAAARAAAQDRIPARTQITIGGWPLALGRALAVACLCLTIATALFGTRDPDRNVSVTLFWQVFLLGMTYATALIGDVFEWLNPWRSLARWMGLDDASRPRLAYPKRLGYWPAVIGYIALAWLELFVPQRPRILASALIIYTVITFAGAFLYGRAAWFRYGEMFSVLLRVVGMLAPIAYRPVAGDRAYSVSWRLPFVGTLAAPADRITLLVFVLVMLASTTYDGLHQTVFWMGLFYKHLLALLQPLWGGNLIAAQAMLEKWYVVYQRAGLVLFPFFYLAIYLAIMRWVKTMTRTAMSVRTLALEFALTIVPIAFVYNLAHYYTLILTRADALPYLLSDPFNRGWNPFGFAAPSGDPPILNMAMVWHTEVALILIGHVVSVYLAHRVALRLFSSRREAMVSQVPLLVLMVLYTVLGLWVISLPFALT